MYEYYTKRFDHAMHVSRRTRLPLVWSVTAAVAVWRWCAALEEALTDLVKATQVGPSYPLLS
jgi:hypothetical protein